MDFIISFNVQLTTIIVCILFIINIFKKVNNNKIKFQEASWWFIKIFLILIASIVTIIVKHFTNFDLSVLFLLAFVITLFTFIYKLDCKMSIKQEEIKILTQKQALLEKRLREVEAKVKEGK